MGVSWRDPRSNKLEVSVVIICHNYGKYLAEAITSVLMQTQLPGEIVIIDDGSTDNTPHIAEMFSDRGIRYRRVETGNIHENRRIGLDITEHPILCFLDADDRLPSDYLARGVPYFEDAQVAVVYSDAQEFGTPRFKRDRGAPYEARKSPEQYDPELLQRINYIHSGSLVRRDALIQSDAWEVHIDLEETHEDWFMWRRVLRGRWQAVRQPAIHQHRRHPKAILHCVDVNKMLYFDLAKLSAETITLFISLSGRMEQWPSLAEFLEKQEWPHDQIQLVLMDTSQSDEFHRAVRDWVSQCDYSDVRLFRHAVGAPKLADEDRLNKDKTVQPQVRLAVAQIYNRLATLVETPYCWTMEDDVRPPLGVCAKLLRSMGSTVAVVVAPYRSRYGVGFCQWRADEPSGRNHSNPIRTAGVGVETIQGSGFGCAVIRRECLKQAAFICSKDFDLSFYAHLGNSAKNDARARRGRNMFPRLVKVDWDMECQHIGAPFYSAFKTWQSEEDWAHWEVGKDIDITESECGLQLRAPASDSQMYVKIEAPVGWYRIIIRCKAVLDITAAFYWKTADNEKWVDHQKCVLPIKASDAVQFRVVHFFAELPVTEFRFDPHDGVCELFVESITLERLDGPGSMYDQPEETAEYLTNLGLKAVHCE